LDSVRSNNLIFRKATQQSNISESQQRHNEIIGKINRAKSVKWKALTRFSSEFWILISLVFVQSFCIQPFVKNAPEIFELKYHMTLQETGIIIAIPDMLLVFMALI